MHVALRRGPTLERGIQAAIVCTVLGAVLAAGSVLSLISTGRALRWVGLAALTILALAWAARRARASASRALLPAMVAGAAFVVVSYASVSWSASPGLTFGRTSAFAFVVVAAAALAAAAADSGAAIEIVVDGLLLGIGAVAAGGLVVLAIDSDRAIDPATTLTAARYQGLGGGPNTATMVLAIGAPLALDAALRATTRSRRLLSGGLAALVVGSIVASGSRGALLSVFGGLLVYVVLRERLPARRLIAATAVLGALATAVFLMRLPDPLPAGATSRRGFVPPFPKFTKIEPNPPYGDANLLLRLQDDIGHPPPGAGVDEEERTLLGSSGRTEAWKGAIEQGRKRPLLGYGFGAEGEVFADRYVSFNSGVPENSYIGLFLQLGAAGLVVFGAIVLAIFAACARTLGRLVPARRGVAAACVGAFAAGLILACFQSFVYAAGNNATAALWISGFLALAATARNGDYER